MQQRPVSRGNDFAIRSQPRSRLGHIGHQRQQKHEPPDADRKKRHEHDVGGAAKAEALGRGHDPDLQGQKQSAADVTEGVAKCGYEIEVFRPANLDDQRIVDNVRAVETD